MTLRFDDAAGNGPLFFPVTPFSAAGPVELDVLRQHVSSRLDDRPAGVFVACGTGEFFSLGLDEYSAVVSAVVEIVGGRMPVVAGAGYGGPLCVEFLRRAGDAGADAVLAFPPYTTAADQGGIVAHYTALAAASPVPVIVYQRDHLRFTAATAEALSGVDNIVGLKDGVGDLENLQRIKATVGDKWIYFNGMPTAELSSGAFLGIGIPNYSSAVFAFLPEVALAFHRSLHSGDTEARDALLREFYLPFADLRDSRQGYAISLIKAGLRLRGTNVGSVRPPLVDPTSAQESQLAALIERGLSAIPARPSS